MDSAGRVWQELSQGHDPAPTNGAENAGPNESASCSGIGRWRCRNPISRCFWCPASEDRLVVLDHPAQAVVGKVRGQYVGYVFTFRRKPIFPMNNTAWQRARNDASLPPLRVHDLKHTFGRRLRAVSLETRKASLGHLGGDITTHYSAPELEELIEAANKACTERSSKSPALVVLEQKMKTR